MNVAKVSDRVDLNERLRSIQTLAWEEGSAKDLHGRPLFPKDRPDEFHSPVVSESLASLFRDIEYPGGKRYAVVLTHDIDLICPSVPRRMVNSGKWLSKGKISGCFQEMGGRRGRTHPYSDLRTIAEKEEAKGGHSTFFMLNSPKDHTGAGYSIGDIAGQLDEVKRIGSEIALHGSYDAAQDPKKIIEEKQGIEKEMGVKVIGYRNHYLRFVVPTSFANLASAGIRYDSTMGFSDNYGFRNGMVHPYHPFIGGSKTSSVLELPLAVMDCALYSYMGSTVVQGKEICEDLIRRTKELHGSLVLLWHNTSFADPRFKEWGDLYWNILDRVKEDGGWLCTGAELSEFWERQGRDIGQELMDR